MRPVSLLKTRACSVEPLESRIAPAFTGMVAGTVLTLQGTAAGDFAIISAVDPTTIAVDDGDVVTPATYSLAGITAVNVVGLAGDDVVTIDLVNGNPFPAQTFSFDGGGDVGDLFVVKGLAASQLAWIPSATTMNAGTVTATNPAGLSLSYLGAPAGVQFNTAASLAVTTPAGIDLLTQGASGGFGLISGTVSGMAQRGTFTGVNNLTVDVGVNDAAATADQYIINALAGPGLTNLTINTGNGADLVKLNATVTSLALPQAGGALTFNLGADTDTFDATFDGNITLTATAVTYSVGATPAGTATVSGIENATLTGGAAANVFNVSGITGVVTANTLGSGDSITISGAGSINTDGGAGDDVFNLTSSGVITALGGTENDTFTLSGGGTLAVDGGDGTNSYNVSAFTGGGNITGGAGGDTLIATNDVADFGLTNSQLTRTGLLTIAFTSIEVANLTGGASPNVFTVSGWSGTGTLDGLGGSDTVVAVNDVAVFGLSNNQLTRTGLGNLALANIEVANLTGGASGNTFNVSNWSGTGTLDGLGSSDILVAVNDVANFGLSDTQLTRTGLGNLTLANLEVSNLTGGAGSNTFTVTGWSGTGTLDGQGSSDTVVAVNDVAAFGLTDTQLTRTGLGNLALLSVEAATLTGGALANTFTVSGWTGTANLDGAAANDTFNVTFNGAAGFVNVTGGAGAADTLNITGTAVADSFSVTTGSVTRGSEAVTFNTVEIVTVNGAGGTNSVTLPNSDDTFTITANRAGSGLGINFTNIDSVDADGGTDTLQNTSGQAYNAATNSVAGITVTNFENVATPSLLLTNGNDSFLVTGTGTGTYLGVNYTGLMNVDALGSSDTITLTGGNDAIQVDGANAMTTFGIAFTNIEAVDAAGGTDSVTLLAGVDAVQVNGPNGATTSGIAFTNIEAIDAGGSSDTVTLLVGNDSIQVNGANAATTSGIAFTNIEAIDAAGGTDSVTLLAGVDAVQVNGANAMTTSSIAFTNIEAVNAAGAADTVTLLAGVDAVQVDGPNAATTSGIAFTNIEAIDAGGSNDSVTLLAGVDAIQINGLNAATTSGIAFTNVEVIDAAGGSDAVTLLAGVDAIQVDGPNAATTSGIAFTNIESVDAAGGLDTVTLRAADDTFTVTGMLAGNGLGIAFTNFEVLDGAGGVNSLNNTSGLVYAAATNTVAGITVANFVNVTTPALSLTAGPDDFTVTSASTSTFLGINYSGLKNIDGLGGTDTIRLTAAGAVNFQLTDSFLGVTGTLRLVLASFEAAVLTGDLASNVFDGSGFSGNLTVNAGDGVNVIIGGTGVNTLNGGVNDDRYVLAPTAISDILTDADGVGDLVDYSLSAAGVTVTLGMAAQIVSPGRTLAMTGSFEQIAGSAFDDTLIGNNVSTVGTGATRKNVDVLYGGDGNDTLGGGKGENYIIGGNGSNTYLPSNPLAVDRFYKRPITNNIVPFIGFTPVVLPPLAPTPEVVFASSLNQVATLQGSTPRIVALSALPPKLLLPGVDPADALVPVSRLPVLKPTAASFSFPSLAPQMPITLIETIVRSIVESSDAPLE